MAAVAGEKGLPTWDSGREQETSFGGTRNRSKPFSERQKVNELYDKLFKRLEDISKAFHCDKFEVIDSRLYYKDKNEPLTLSYLEGGGGNPPPSCFSSTILKRLKL